MSIVKLNNRGVKDATAFGSITGLGNLKFISRSTASSATSMAITSNINSTYKEYIFIINNLHPSADGVEFSFQGSTDGGSNYGVSITSTNFSSYHRESGASSGLGYEAGGDLANSTSEQRLRGIGLSGADNDQCNAAILHLFDPSNTTFVKNFLWKVNNNEKDDYIETVYVGGYFNTTSAIDALRFSVNSGNIDSGTIDMYGVS
tara:strand:+ start:288 stop:899 length:612 start_codon:yes stop_codon:yes gene_type:complete